MKGIWNVKHLFKRCLASVTILAGLTAGTAQAQTVVGQAHGLTAIPLPFQESAPGLPEPPALPPPTPEWATKPAARQDRLPESNRDNKPNVRPVSFQAPVANPPKANPPIHDPNIKKTGCTGCGVNGVLGVIRGDNGTAYSGGSCASGNCVPGRTNCCSWCNYDTHLGRLIGGFYDCICCPDPCYDPRWLPEANAAFFQDSPRPVTQTLIRWDSVANRQGPDAAEYFWARTGGGGNGPALPEQNVDYDELLLYQEVSTGKLSFIFAIPYRNLDPVVNQPNSGFGDLQIGTKNLLLDCELLQFSFQFMTYIPTGNASRGLGTGHVSLEPSFLSSLKLTNCTYLQTQIAQWIPISGDSNIAGSVLHWHTSLNQRLWQATNDLVLVGTAELNGWSYQNGFYIDPIGIPNSINGASYINAGPGLRLVFCNKLDFGFGAAFNIGNKDLGPEAIYRTEFRVRY